MPDDNLRYLTTNEKAALLIWRNKIEPVLALGGEVATELMFWLSPMGAVYSSGLLSFPASKKSTRSSPFTGIERYFNLVHARCQPTTYYNTGIAKLTNDYFAYTKYSTTAYISLIAAYPRSSTILAVLNKLYDRVEAVLVKHDATIRAAVSGYNRAAIIGGLLVLFETFSVWGSKYWATDAYWSEFYVAASSSGTVGPYTVTVDYCNNGVVFGIVMDEPMHTAHQSVDAEMALQSEVRSTLSADTLLSTRQVTELPADLVLQGGVKKNILASAAVQGDVQTPLLADEALQDLVTLNLPADGLLAEQHTYSLAASARMLLDHHAPLDADICVLAPVRVALSASIYLEPDFASEIMTDLEQFFWQSPRIRAAARSYKVYNSQKNADFGVVP